MRLFRARFLVVILLASVVDTAWAATGQTLFTTQTPQVDSSSNGGSNFENALAFYSVAAGQITAVRFWKSNSESGAHVGKIWSSGGTLLASVTFVNETKSGWQQQALASPISITANTTYIVSVNTDHGHYVYTNNALQTQVANGSLRSVVGNNGRFALAGQFPSTGTSGTNFFRDIVFVPFPTVASVALNPSSVTGGNSSVGTVTLTSAALTGGAVVTLSSNNPLATVPASITIAAGSTTGTFTVATTAAGVATTLASISGSYNFSSGSAILTINTPALATISLNPSSVIGGSTSTGTVTLTLPAPAGGAAVTLSSSNAAAVVPASVTVGAGSTTGTFTVTTTAVGATISASISATYKGSQSAGLTINSPVLSTIILNPNSVTGGSGSTGTAILTGPAPAGGALVVLSSINPVLPGIQGVHSPVDLPQDGSINWANLGPVYSSIPSGSVTPVTGLPSSHATLSTVSGLPLLTLTNCNSGGNCGWYGNFAPGAAILWTSGTYNGDTGWWAPNGALTMQFDTPQRGVGFQMMADEIGPFTATLCAYNAANDLLGCIPFDGNGANTADGSAAYMGLYDDVQEISKVTIDACGQLYPHDFAIGEVYVASTRRQLVPASVTVPAGATGVTFPVNTSAVITATVATVTGSYVTTRSASLGIDPPVLAAISLNPASVTGGASSTGTATLSGPSPVGGVVVTLAGNNPGFTGIQPVPGATGLPHDGSISWTGFGPSFTSVPSGTVVPITGLPGGTVSVTTTSGLSPMVLTNCPAAADCGWKGNFVPAGPLLWVGGSYDALGNWVGNGPLILTLSTPQRGFGSNIMADELGPFTATVCAYNAANSLLGCVPFSGNGTAAADGSAIFIGLYDDAAEISKVTIDAGGALYPHDFAIGQAYVDNTQRTLVPATVTVPPGANSATFPVTANVVNTPTSVGISGSYSGSRTATLDIHP